MQTNRPNIKNLKPLPAPARFNPTDSWVEGDFLYRFDSEQYIVKRSPVTTRASAGTMYFRVDSASVDEAHINLVAPKKRVKPKGLARKRPSLPKRSESRWSSRPRFRTSVARPRSVKLLKPALALAIVAALAVFIYPWVPEIQYRVYSATPAAEAQATKTTPNEKPIEGNRLWIPKIGVDTPIVEGSSLDILKTEEGVWHQSGSQDFANFVLAGHRFKYLPPNTSTLYNLDKLESGDTLAVDWDGRRTIYKVDAKKTVNANDVSILNPTFSQTVTIYTCSDKQETQRIVVTAKPI